MESSTSRRSQSGLCATAHQRAVWAATTVLAPTSRSRLASAIRHIDRNDPPFLLIHSSSLGKPSRRAQSERFHAALQAGAVESQLTWMRHVDHGFIGRATPSSRATPACARYTRRTPTSLDATLRAAH